MAAFDIFYIIKGSVYYHVVVEVGRQDEDCLADRALDWRVFADCGLADVAGVVGPTSLEVAEAQALALQVFLAAESHLELAEFD